MYFLVINDYGRTVYVNSRQVNAVLVGDGVLFAILGNTTSVLSTTDAQMNSFIQNIALEDYFLDLRDSNGHGYIVNLSAMSYTDEAPPETIFIYFKVGTMIQVDYSNKTVLDDALANYVEATGGGGGNGNAITESVLQASHGFTVGTLVRFNGSVWVRSQADQDDNSDVYGIVTLVSNASSFTITTSGLVTVLSGLTSSVPYYLDPAVPGGFTQTPPDVAGYVSKPILLSISSTSALFVNMRGLIIPPGLGGNSSSAEVDFTATPSTDAQVVVTGQYGIYSDSMIKAWLVAVPTTDHTLADHLAVDLTIVPGSLVTDVGFTIYIKSNSGPLTGKYSIQWQWS